jgi:hypothetical protein
MRILLKVYLKVKNHCKKISRNHRLIKKMKKIKTIKKKKKKIFKNKDQEIDKKTQKLKVKRILIK